MQILHLAVALSLPKLTIIEVPRTNDEILLLKTRFASLGTLKEIGIAIPIKAATNLDSHFVLGLHLLPTRVALSGLEPLIPPSAQMLLVTLQTSWHWGASWLGVDLPSVTVEAACTASA